MKIAPRLESANIITLKGGTYNVYLTLFVATICSLTKSYYLKAINDIYIHLISFSVLLNF